MRFRSALLTILLVTSATSALADAPTCQNFIKTQTEKAVAVFHDKATSEQDKRKQLAVIFRESVDTDWIGRTVLGRYWKELKTQQQQTYLMLYGKYLASSYITKFDAEDGMNVDSIKIVAFNPSANGGYEAKTLIENKADPAVRVDYTVDDSAGSCKVHDVKVEGVSLMISQRSEFGSIAAQGGPAKIITLMQDQLRHNPQL